MIVDAIIYVCTAAADPVVVTGQLARPTLAPVAEIAKSGVYRLHWTAPCSRGLPSSPPPGKLYTKYPKINFTNPLFTGWVGL